MKNAFVIGLWPLFLLALLSSSAARAVTTESFTLDQAKDFEAGELEGTAAHSDGYVRLGAATERISLDDVPVAYSLTRKGKTVFIGTGTNGDIYSYDGKKPTLFAKTGELLVSAMAVASDGSLYAGTLPHGRIYRIDPKTGKIEKFAELPDIKHVWALYYDSHRRRLIAGTGPTGQLLALDPIGRATVLHQAEASHVMSLTSDGKGTLYAGTSDEAIVLRVRPNDRVDVVHDFAGSEVTALDFREGMLAVATNDFPKTPGAPISKQTNGQADEGAKPRAGKGKLWKVGADGRVEQLIARDDTHLTAVQWGSGGAVFAATGEEGRILKVQLDGTYAVWADVEERQVLALDLNEKNPVFVTGDAAALYEVINRPPRKAVWTSAPLDAGVLSSWGRLQWRGQGALSFETRSGNTEKPNDTWSPWSKSLRKSGKVSSPPGRFVQVRALFPSNEKEAELHAVELYYLPDNQPMRVSQITGKPATVKDGEERTHPPSPSPKIELSWTVRNPDQDPPRYRLYFREESQSTWRPIFTEDVVLTETEYVWDTSSIPDGYYLVRVEASDEESNPVALSNSAQAISKPIRVDNHPPTVESLRARQGRVMGKASDALGPIARIQYAVDGGRWRDVFPKDGLLDDRLESFEFDVREVSAGSHIVSVRVFDSAGNQASREITVKAGQ
jgi:outer membrane protein assembly factor BamB